MRNSDPQPTTSLPSLEQTLESVLHSRHEIAAELQQTAASLSGAARRRCRALGHWFDQPISADHVLQCPDALAVCLPLLKPAERGTITHLDVEDAVAYALDPLSRPTSRARRLIADLIYPIVLLLFSGFFWFAFAVFLAPMFEQMFDEFALDLPPASSAVLGLARITRQWGPAAVALLLLLLGLSLAARFAQRRWHRRPLLSRLISRWFSGRRAAWAAWARHVALLLDAGLAQREAISRAGRASEQAWIGRVSESWAEQMREEAEQMREERNPFIGPMYLSKPPGHLLKYTLQLDELADQAELLHEVTAIDSYRDQSRSRWWVWWVTPVAVCGLGAMIGLIVSALFMPLVSLLTGLT